MTRIEGKLIPCICTSKDSHFPTSKASMRSLRMLSLMELDIPKDRAIDGLRRVFFALHSHRYRGRRSASSFACANSFHDRDGGQNRVKGYSPSVDCLCPLGSKFLTESDDSQATAGRRLRLSFDLWSNFDPRSTLDLVERKTLKRYYLKLEGRYDVFFPPVSVDSRRVTILF